MAELNQVLTDYYNSPEPNPDFARQLEKQLASRHHELLHIPQNASLGQGKKAFWLIYPRSDHGTLDVHRGSFGLLLAGAYTLARLKGYLPGFGFVSDAGKTFVLSQPVKTSRTVLGCRWKKLSANPHYSGWN